ncbi:MAG: hydrolase [Candidatus Poribacteria bacterium]|nr:MAG: hydrolase [Candidatus Poribacteria bacterium]
MEVRFWGVQGSIPAPLTTGEYLTKLRSVLLSAHGVDLSSDERIEQFIQGLDFPVRHVIRGDTTCISVTDGETLLIFDAGSGLRRLGIHLMSLPDSPYARGQGQVHLFFSHHHHDHTNGFPFFTPAYIPGNWIYFYGLHPNLEERMVGLQVYEYFPVPFHVMAAKKAFISLEPDQPITVGAFTITPFELKHPGGAYGYRVEWKDRVFVYSSDSEFQNPSAAEIFYYTHAYRDADLLYFDAQYTLTESFVKEDWGHSSAWMGIDLSVRARVKRLLLGHHEPSHSEEELFVLLEEARRYLQLNYPEATLEVLLAVQDQSFRLE